jgi:hypothetical protein
LEQKFFFSADMKGPPCAVRIRNGPEKLKLDDKI